MLRTRLNEALKLSMKAQDPLRTSTLRLILAALKDRDIAARGRGSTDEITDDEILSMFQAMVKQRRDAIGLYEKGGRLELAQREADEIDIIEEFLPRQLSDEEAKAAVAETIGELGATCLKDMGRIMAALKERYSGRMDFAQASVLVKKRLG